MRAIALAVLGRRAEDRHTAWQIRVMNALRTCRQRIHARRLLAQMDARTLRDAGIDPMAAQFEVMQPFWVAERRLR